MSKSQILLLCLMAERPIATTAYLRGGGVHPRVVIDAIEGGVLHRVAPGMVVTSEVYADPLLDDAIACLRTGGVICHLSAAMRHNLCDALPAKLELLVPNELTKIPAGLPVRILRTRNPKSLAVGVEVSYLHGVEIRMTTAARTIVDLYRIEPAATRQHAVASLTRYLWNNLPVGELSRAAKAFGMWDVIRPEIEAVMETMDQGMQP